MSKYQWVILTVFFAMWLYTEISEYHERGAFYQEVDAFIHKGDRFTADDGRALKARIEALEAQSKPAASPQDTARGTSQ